MLVKANIFRPFYLRKKEEGRRKKEEGRRRRFEKK
jgi:hypothetical protein